MWAIVERRWKKGIQSLDSENQTFFDEEVERSIDGRRRGAFVQWSKLI